MLRPCGKSMGPGYLGSHLPLSASVSPPGGRPCHLQVWGSPWRRFAGGLKGAGSGGTRGVWPLQRTQEPLAQFPGRWPCRGFLRWVCPRFPAAVGGGIPEAGGQFPPLPPAPASRACCSLELRARHAGSRPAAPPTWWLWRVLGGVSRVPSAGAFVTGNLRNRKSPRASTWETLGPDGGMGAWASRVYAAVLVLLPSL